MKPDEGAAGATHTGKATQTNASARQRRTAARGALRTNCGNAGKTADRGVKTADEGEGTADEGAITADELRKHIVPSLSASTFPVLAGRVGRRSGRGASATERAGADLGAADPALPLEPPAVPRREAVPAVPRPWPPLPLTRWRVSCMTT